jgi:hypothetical protein
MVAPAMSEAERLFAGETGQPPAPGAVVAGRLGVAHDEADAESVSEVDLGSSRAAARIRVRLPVLRALRKRLEAAGLSE